MSVRQYIGARYVTKVYENSLDPSSAEWEASVTYEPLTMVTYNNSSYLSKREVPGSVGDPASNPTYWVVTGAYNGQILNLQNQINVINDDVTDLQNKFSVTNRKFVVIADSYGNINNTNGHNFYVQAFYDLGITDYYDFHLNGAGFAQPGAKNFLNLLQANESAISDKTKITDILVLGGANEQEYPADIESGIASFMTYVKTNYPNATVKIGHFSNSIQDTLIPYLAETIEKYKLYAPLYGAQYIENSQYVMAKLSFFNDTTHPTESGIRALTKYLTQFLLTGSFNVHETATNCLQSNLADMTITTQNLYFIQNNGVVTLEVGGGAEGIVVEFSPSRTFTTGYSFLAFMFEVVDGFFYSALNNKPCIEVLMGDSSDWQIAYLTAMNVQPTKKCYLSLSRYCTAAQTLSTCNMRTVGGSWSLFD